MKSLFDIFSGNRLRANKADEAVFGEAMARFRASTHNNDEDAVRFATALGVSTALFSRSLFFESDMKAYRQIGRDLDYERLRDFAALVAWWATWKYNSDVFELTAAGSKEAPRTDEVAEWTMTTSAVTNVMYPRSPRVCEAVEMIKRVEADPNADEFVHANTYYDATNRVVGVTSDLDSDADFGPNLILVNGLFAEHRHVLAESFGGNEEEGDENDG
jgi:hypothetical protein